jgi:MFS family permease
MQNYLDLTPLQSGVRFLPSTIASFLFAMLAGQLVSRLPARFLLAVGLTGVGGGLLLMAGIHDGDDWTGLLGGLVLTGACLGLLNPVISSVAVGVVPREQSGMASGINQTFRQVGIAVGIAAWGALFLGRGADKVSQLAAHTPAATGDRPRQIVEAASSGALGPVLRNVPANARDAVANAAHQGFLAGLNEILVAAAVLAFVGAVLSLILVRTEDAGHQPAPSSERTAEPAAA